MKRDIIAIGASAGGIETICEILTKLPKELNAAVLIVVHMEERPNNLSRIFSRCTEHPVVNAEHNKTIKNGCIYVSKPSQHTLVKNKKFVLTRGPKINKFRPSIDIFFESIAESHAQQTVGILLTGLLFDGAQGLSEIKNKGGVTIVQDPKDAAYPDLPLHAVNNYKFDYCLPVRKIPGLLGKLIQKEIKYKKEKKTPSSLSIQLKGSKGKKTPAGLLNIVGTPSTFTCPECHGTLWEISEKYGNRFRCRTGHSYTIESLFDSELDTLENVLWSGVRALEELANLSSKISGQLKKNQNFRGATFYARKSANAQAQAMKLRTVILDKNLIQKRVPK